MNHADMINEISLMITECPNVFNDLISEAENPIVTSGFEPRGDVETSGVFAIKGCSSAASLHVTSYGDSLFSAIAKQQRYVHIAQSLPRF